MFSAKLQVHGVENSSSKCACMMTGSKSFRIIQVILSDGPGSLMIDDFSTLLTLKNTTPKPTVQK